MQGDRAGPAAGEQGSGVTGSGDSRDTGEIPRGDSTDSAGGTRAVSYALGFVIVFSAVLAGTLALFAVGVDVLSDVGSDETLAANQEAVEVIHAEVGDVAAGGADSRDLTLELVDARLRFADSDPLELSVTFDSPGTESGGQTVVYESQALHYELPDHGTTFVYAFGHAYRVGDGGALGERLPVFEVSETRTRLVVPTLTGATEDSPTQMGVTGTGERDLAALRSSGSSFTRTAGDGITGTVTVEGVARPSVWERALTATGFEAVEASGEVVTGEFESEQLLVQQADITLAFGGEEP